MSEQPTAAMPTPEQPAGRRPKKKREHPRRWPWAVGAGIVGIIIGTSGGNNASTAQPDAQTAAVASPAPTVTVTAPAAATAPAPTVTVTATVTAAAAPVAAAPAAGTNTAKDGKWSASDIQVKDDGLGDFGGTLRLSGPDASAASVQLSVLKGGSVVATMSGASSNFSGTETVQLISSDKYTSGDYDYELKVTSF